MSIRKINIGLQNQLEVIETKSGYNLLYYNEEPEVITREILQELSILLVADSIVLHTNCGLDLHSTEKELYGIEVKKFSYFDYQLVKDDIHN
jgi:hypothetical protein